MHRAESSLAAIALFGGAAGVILAASALADTPRAARAKDAPTDVVSQEIEVRLAEIEVVVTDRQGDPVAGLTREDFSVLQDGRAVELTHFRAVGGRGVEINGGTPDAPDTEPVEGFGAASRPEADDRLHLVIYVDRGYLEPGDLGDVRQALRDFLRQSLHTGDRVMLVTAAHSLDILQAFTSVPELVVSQLDGIQVRPGGGRLSREYQSILVEMRRVKNEGNDLMARDPSRQARTYVSRIQAYAAEVEGEIRQTTAQLRQLIQSIAGLPGRRAVLYIGGRVPAANGRRLYDAWEEAFGRNSNLQIADNPGGADTGVGGGAGATAGGSDTGLDSLAAASASFDLGAQRSVQEVVEAASAHDVIFHTLDAGSMRDSTFLAPGGATLAARGSSGNPGAALAAGSLADSMASLRALAWGTGGRAFAGGRDFAGALARVGSDLRTSYVLGFEPLVPKGERSRIEVQLRRPDDATPLGKLKVRHRSVLDLKDRDTLAAERTVSALLLEEMENPLAVEVSAGEPVAIKKGQWRVPVAISVPLSKLALVADGRVHAGRLSIYTASGNLNHVGAVTKAVVPVRIPNQDLLTSLGRRVAYELDLTLSAGLERIAVTVRDDFRPRSSTAVAGRPLSSEGTGPADVAARSEPDSR